MGQAPPMQFDIALFITFTIINGSKPYTDRPAFAAEHT